MKQGDYRSAVYYAKKLFEACPDSEKHLKMRIKSAIYYAPNNLGEILRLTQSVAEIFNDSAVFHFWHGRVLLYRGDVKKANEHLCLAIELDPNNEKYRNF